MKKYILLCLTISISLINGCTVKNTNNVSFENKILELENEISKLQKNSNKIESSLSKEVETIKESLQNIQGEITFHRLNYDGLEGLNTLEWENNDYLKPIYGLTNHNCYILGQKIGKGGNVNIYLGFLENDDSGLFTIDDTLHIKQDDNMKFRVYKWMDSRQASLTKLEREKLYISMNVICKKNTDLNNLDIDLSDEIIVDMGM